MRYKIDELEDQIIATLTADTTNFSTVFIKTYAGQISSQMFINPEYMQGFKALLPFVLVSYQGRHSSKIDWDSTGVTRIHEPIFRIFTGAKSANKTQDAVRNCYDMMTAEYDDLHGKVPLCSPQQLSGYTALSGTAVTSTGFNPQSALNEIEGKSEQLVVNLPGIVVYQTDYTLRLVA